MPGDCQRSGKVWLACTAEHGGAIERDYVPPGRKAAVPEKGKEEYTRIGLHETQGRLLALRRHAIAQIAAAIAEARAFKHVPATADVNQSARTDVIQSITRRRHAGTAAHKTQPLCSS